MTKSHAELALMRQTKNMTLEVQRRGALILREGIAASEVRRFIDEAHRAIGAEAKLEDLPDPSDLDCEEEGEQGEKRWAHVKIDVSVFVENVDEHEAEHPENETRRGV